MSRRPCLRSFVGLGAASPGLALALASLPPRDLGAQAVPAAPPRCYDGVLGADAQARRVIVRHAADSMHLTFHGRPGRTVVLAPSADEGGVTRWQSSASGASRFTVTFGGDSAVVESVSAVRTTTGVLRPAREAVRLSALTGVWETAVGPGGLLQLTIHLRADSCGLLVGTMDSPDQGQRDLPLTDVGADADSITIAAEYLGLRIRVARPARWDDAARDGLRGVFEQGGAVQPLTLRRRAVASARARPQDPAGQRPYTERDVRVGSASPGIQLSGTLTLPRGRGPHPAVVLISGSGAQDRDESIAGHRPFLVLADHLTRHGFAVLRTDDRGFGTTGYDMRTARLEDLADDVEAALAFLRTQPEIDARRVGLLGHSEGGYLATMVAARDTAVRFVVLMAGPAVPGRVLLLSQRAALLRASGETPRAVRVDSALLHTIFEAIAGSPGPQQLASTVDAAVERGLRGLRAEERSVALAQLQQRTAAQDSASIALWSSAWFRSFFAHDPSAALASMRVPVLAIFGGRDVQVPPTPSVDALRRAFAGARAPLLTTHIFPGLNHLMQPARTGLLEEYRSIDTTIAPTVLDTMTTWLRRHAGALPRPSR